jgi:hypothetical protein
MLDRTATDRALPPAEMLRVTASVAEKAEESSVEGKHALSLRLASGGVMRYANRVRKLVADNLERERSRTCPSFRCNFDGLAKSNTSFDSKEACR